MEYEIKWSSVDGALQAFEVRRRVYIEEYGFDLGGRGPKDDIDDRAQHLLVTAEGGEPVASLRLVDAADRPFEIERFVDINSHIVNCVRPAEVTRMCIAQPYRRITHASFVHVVLLRALLEKARELGISHIVASTRAELSRFYAYSMFETVPDVTYRHPEIGGALHIFMMLDVGRFRRRCRLERPTLYSGVFDIIGEDE
jgi:predicted GNAT family N-acyltransferase